MNLKIKAGDVVKPKHWTNCVVRVEDVGSKSFWGALGDVKTDELIDPYYIGTLDQEWIKLQEIHELLVN